MLYTNQIEAIRKALIIGSPGIEGADYLYSVSTDVTNIKNHLLSSRGGKWKEDEIISLWNPSLTDLSSVLQNTIADYLFVYYAGHGYENADGDRMICLSDVDVSDFFLLNNCPRILTIIDCCREKEYPAISGIPEEDDWLHFDGYYPEREAFNKYILQSPVGRKIIHATKSGFASWEDKNGRGGVFTTSLLLSARTFNTGVTYSPVSIELLIKKAKKIIEHSGEIQEPEVVYSCGDMMVPFTLVLKSEPVITYTKSFDTNRPRKILKKTNSNSESWVMGVVAVAAIIAIINSD